MATASVSWYVANVSSQQGVIYHTILLHESHISFTSSFFFYFLLLLLSLHLQHITLSVDFFFRKELTKNEKNLFLMQEAILKVQCVTSIQFSIILILCVQFTTSLVMSGKGDSI